MGVELRDLWEFLGTEEILVVSLKTQLHRAQLSVLRLFELLHDAHV